MTHPTLPKLLMVGAQRQLEEMIRHTDDKDTKAYLLSACESITRALHTEEFKHLKEENDHV